MTDEEKFHEAMLNIYKQAGEETGYWANYFLRDVKRNGGLACAHKMLKPRKDSSIQKGLQALIDAGRIELSVESLCLSQKFNHLFSDDEKIEAKKRLSQLPDYVKHKDIPPEQVFPENMPSDLEYSEGATKKIIVNAFERDKKAREACLKKYGYNCSVCEINFEETYGEIGKGFIHVHHKKPLATIRAEYKLDPIKDLIPVCPNCHAMLHKSEPPLAVSELKRHLKNKC